MSNGEERVSSAYEHDLQGIYLDIGNRGIRVDLEHLERGKQIVESEIKRNLAVCSAQWSCIVFLGADNAPSEDEEDEDENDGEGSDITETSGEESGAVNINATQGKYALLKKLKDLGYEVPKITQKKASGDYDQKESTGELAIQKMLSANQFEYPGGDPALRAILKIRELGKLKTSYFNALLYRSSESYFLSNYNVAGTLTGRRSSRKHTFGFGANAQNFPKHSSVASLFRRCLVPRIGNVFLFVDQIQAEDYPVSALAGNLNALKELKDGVDRHSKLASVIFNKRVPAKNDPDWDEALHGQDRYIGKKARHASNYGMDAFRFADVLAQEAQLSVSPAVCKQILATVDTYDPSVKGVFHTYIKNTLNLTRTLITPEPFLRERTFLSLRPGDANSAIYKEAYAYIPQSTVADNTGFAIRKMAMNGTDKFIVNECHDSITQDIPATADSIYQALINTALAFQRTIRFYNGIEINIPIEAEIGFDFDKTVRIKKFTFDAVKEALEKLNDLKAAKGEKTYENQILSLL
jgi:DNA polymerase I-like protein with 3'-5' exonuclease and polymerase domains